MNLDAVGADVDPAHLLAQEIDVRWKHNDPPAACTNGNQKLMVKHGE